MKELDQRPWLVPSLAFVLSELTLFVLYLVSSQPMLFAALGLEQRRDTYSSLAGTSGSLLGFTIAAVAILAAFGPRAKSGASGVPEEALARARGKLAICLMVTSIFLLILLVTTSFGLALDTTTDGNSLISNLTTGAAIASILGLIVGGAALALAVVERSRNPA